MPGPTCSTVPAMSTLKDRRQRLACMCHLARTNFRIQRVHATRVDSNQHLVRFETRPCKLYLVKASTRLVYLPGFVSNGDYLLPSPREPRSQRCFGADSPEDYADPLKHADYCRKSRPYHPSPPSRGSLEVDRERCWERPA